MIQAIAANLGLLARRPVPSPRTTIFLAIAFFAGTLGYHATAAGATWYNIAAIALITTVVVLVTLYLVTFGLDRLPRKSIALLIVGSLIVGVVRATAAYLVARVLGLELVSGPLFSFLTSVLITTIILLGVAVISAYFRSAKVQTAQLIEENHQIEREQLQLDAANSQGREAMAALISDVALPAITQSKSALNSARNAGQVDTDSLMALATEIRDKSETEIRQLSHTLSDSATPAPQLVPEAPSSDVDAAGLTRRQWFKRAWLTCEIYPLISTIVFALLMLPTFLGQEGRGMATVSLVLACLSMLVILYLGSGLLWLVRSRGSASWSAVVMSVVYVAAAVAASIFSTDVLTTWTTPDWFIPLMVSLTAFVAGWVVSLVFAADREQKVRQREIAAQTATRKLYAARLEHLLLATQKAAANILHTRVQGRFIAAAMTVGRAAKINAGDDPESVQQRLESLQAAIDILQQTADEIEALQGAQSVQVTELDAALQAVAKSWTGVLEVAVSVADSAASEASQQPGLTEWIADVVREAISNAARHGAARRVWIEVESDGHCVRIQADNDGLPLASKPRPGLEARRTMKAGGTWALTSENGPVRLVVELPLRAAQTQLRAA